ncbi:MAG: lipase maturation factor family protein [Methylococcaceae bacterium]|nr:lipase maturation factor family protein [Methylococcaceae bacterium]
MPREHWPALLRGDRDWGTEANLQAAEQAGLPYLFKLRLTSNTRRLVERLMLGNQWVKAGQGWQAAESELRLTGWSCARRVVVLRRQLKKNLAVVGQNQQGPRQLSFAELTDDDVAVYEYSVLVTSLDIEMLSVAQLYRDRADAENSFDELKNHWGWGGFTTQDLKRCRFMARITALVYNWWSLFVRLADPDRHTEAITSRPLMLYGIGRQTRHAGQTRLTVSSTHAEAVKVEQCYRRIAAFFKELWATAEQFNAQQRWCRNNPALKAVCLAGIGAALMVTVNFLVTPALIVCYVLYLSIATAGQDFTGFQWDVFLLESGFLAIFLPGNSKIIHFLYRLLIARFMFMGGVVKIASGDPTWADLTALKYHYWTQPLPTPLGYYAHFLPEWWQQFCTAGVMFIELVVPLGVFMPRPFRLFAAWSFILLQSCIVLTGNYNFFNLLALLLCLFLFDDSDLAKITPQKLYTKLQQNNRSPSTSATFCSGIWAAMVVLILTTHLWMAQTQQRPYKILHELLQTASNFAVVNNYGPFAVMTTERNEIIIEGSNDGVHWLEYGFKYKPDSLDKPLSWNIPHQPRLDWQLWFAALSRPQSGGWFEKFMHRLQQGLPEVLALMASNPFPNLPPKYLRAVWYRCTFTTSDKRAATGKVWKRERLGNYYELNENYYFISKLKNKIDRTNH